tara:strand:+ start:19 stop:300 length:282 start_codon:yes stop_codon:yes gene_type:complete
MDFIRLMIFAFSLPVNPRDLYKQRLEIKINCWQNIIDAGNMDWKERENAFEQLSILHYENYVIDNVPQYEDYHHLDYMLNTTDTELDWFDITD